MEGSESFPCSTESRFVDEMLKLTRKRSRLESLGLIYRCAAIDEVAASHAHIRIVKLKGCWLSRNF